MSDLIDKQQAIEAICMETCGVSLKNERCMVHCTEVQAVEKLPPAQPDVPDINVGDMISRQAAIDYFVINVGFHDEDGYPIEDTDELRKIWTEYFDGIPSAQPERIKGRWISADAIFGGVPFYCSECGENTRDTVMGKPRWNFCPNCGAEMDVTE